MDGLSTWGSSGSVETEMSGRALTMAHTSAMKVTRTSWVSGLFDICGIVASMICLAVPIICSHTPPCEIHVAG